MSIFLYLSSNIYICPVFISLALSLLQFFSFNPLSQAFICPLIFVLIVSLSLLLARNTQFISNCLLRKVFFHIYIGFITIFFLCISLSLCTSGIISVRRNPSSDGMIKSSWRLTVPHNCYHHFPIS
jgi:hypothetical protein